MRINRNLRLIDLFTICSGMMFVLPVIIPYYRDQAGLGFQDFLLGEAAFAATVILLDVPTGWLSDKWQRKYTLLLGLFFDVLGFSLLMIADNLMMMIAAQMLIGVAISLCSGTNTAMLYDSLLSVGREKEYRQREGRRMALSLYTVAFCCVLGAFMYKTDHHLPIAMTLLFLIIGMICAALMDEPARHKPASQKHPIADIIATTKYALHGHKEIAIIILFSAFLFCSTKLIMWSQQPYYISMKIPEMYFGIFMAVGFLLGGSSSHLAHLLDGKISTHKFLIGLWILAFIVCLASGLFTGWHGVLLLMIGGTCIFGMGSPRVNEVINRNVTSDKRATILSTQSLMVSVFFIPLSSALGWIDKHSNVETGLLSLAGLLFAVGITLAGLVLYRQKSIAR